MYFVEQRGLKTTKIKYAELFEHCAKKQFKQCTKIHAYLILLEMDNNEPSEINV